MNIMINIDQNVTLTLQIQNNMNTKAYLLLMLHVDCNLHVNKIPRNLNKKEIRETVYTCGNKVLGTYLLKYEIYYKRH